MDRDAGAGTERRAAPSCCPTRFSAISSALNGASVSFRHGFAPSIAANGQTSFDRSGPASSISLIRATPIGSPVVLSPKLRGGSNPTVCFGTSEAGRGPAPSFDVSAGGTLIEGFTSIKVAVFGDGSLLLEINRRGLVIKRALSTSPFSSFKGDFITSPVAVRFGATRERKAMQTGAKVATVSVAVIKDGTSRRTGASISMSVNFS